MSVIATLFISMASVGILAANGIYYWMIYRVNVAIEPEQQISYFHSPWQMMALFRGHKRFYPRSVLPQAFWVCFIFSAATLVFSVPWLAPQQIDAP